MGKIYEALERQSQEEGSAEGKAAKRRRSQPEPKQPRSRESRRSSPKERERGSTIPDTPNEELVVLGRPGSSIAEKFRFLRSKVCRPLSGQNPRTVLVTSSLAGEGKTFISSNLAATIAQGLDEHVLLVDADLRNPRIHEVFNLNDAKGGLATHLQDGTPLPDLLYKTDIEKLTILPAGMHAENPAELLSSSRMKKFIIEVRHRYPDRYVIFDSSPMELSPEFTVIAKEMEGVYLVVRRGSTPRDIVKGTLDKLDAEKFLGVVFNGYDLPRSGNKRYQGYSSYGYGYGYGYSGKRRDAT